MISVLKLYGILAIIGGAALALSLFIGISPCILYHIIGIPCPACGLTRAFVSLARLDLAQAFAYHPLFVFVPFAPLLGIERLPDKWRSILSFGALGVLVAVWVVRMILLFPHTAPFTYNTNSLFEWLFWSR